MPPSTFVARDVPLPSHGIGLIVVRVAVSAVAFLVWESAIMLPDEVDFIWLSPWRPIKLVYFFVRYFSLFAVSLITFPAGGCQHWEAFNLIAIQVLMTAVDLILMLRVHAIYERRASIKWLMLAGFVINNLVLVCGLAIGAPRLQVSHDCEHVIVPFAIVLTGIVAMLFKSLLFGLTMYKFVAAVREGWGRQSILAIIVRDGTWAFALIFVVLLVNLIAFMFAPPKLAAIGFPWLVAVHGFCGTRLVVNIRREFYRLPPRDIDSLTANPESSARSRARAAAAMRTSTALSWLSRSRPGEEIALSTIMAASPSVSRPEEHRHTIKTP